MQSSFRRILTGALFFLITVITGISGYIMAGWTPLEAIYMVVITIFGVGYGEVRPLDSTALKIFTILLIIAGTTSAVYIVGGFVQLITEGEIRQALGARRMERSIESLQNHVIVCGYGRVGQLLARELVDVKQTFVVIDQSDDRLQRAATMGYLTRIGNATDESVLEAVGIARAKVLATVLPDDAANVFITLTARSLNQDLTILARGEYPSTEKKLRQAGADHVILPAAIGAQRMAHLITHPAALDLLEQNNIGGSNLNEILARIDVKIDELAVPPDSPLVGATIADVEVRGKGTFIVVALQRSDGTGITHPPGTAVLAAGDTVIVMGHRGDIPQFAHNYSLKRQMKYRGANH